MSRLLEGHPGGGNVAEAVPAEGLRLEEELLEVATTDTSTCGET